jgi:putative ABC transport system ATP-binding protein
MKIKTLGLTRVYHVGSAEIIAVKKVNLEISEAEFIAVRGPSGSGKSTFLNLIGLNDCPTSGKILMDGMDTAALSGGERRRTRLFRIGFVFQTFNLLPTLNAMENVELPLALSGKSREEQEEKALRLLDTVGLSSRLHHRPRELSVGEMQRVALARAAANDPEAIIADEPTGELDSKTAREIIGLLREITKKHKATVIVATHDEEIAKAADKIYMIQDGKLRLDS